MFTDSTVATQTLLTPVRGRNSLLDTWFYDVGALTPQELSTLSPLVDREGTIIVVSPTDAGKPIRHYKSALRFIVNEGDAISAIAVAGVGSSVVGTAALARNVADAYGIEVAGLVTGYGMADLLSEALGGWFFYGAMDEARLEWKRLLEQLKDTLPESDTWCHRGNGRGPRTVSLPGNQDTGTLLDVLIARPKSLKLLVGHSKGSLLIDFVLERFARELEGASHPYFDELTIVTFGTVVGLPERFTRRTQFIGALDWFGKMNSRQGVEHQVVPDAWHHLNTRYPYHLSVVEALKRVPIDRPSGKSKDTTTPRRPQRAS